MQRLISSFATAVLLFLPTTAVAQHRFGGEYYQNDDWQNQGGGDTVIYYNGPHTGGRVLTNNLTPNIDTCYWVREAARLPCEYFGNEPNSTGYTTHFVGRPRRNNQNTHQWQSPGWNNNSGNWHTQPWNGGGGGGCLYKQWNRNSGFQVGNC